MKYYLPFVIAILVYSPLFSQVNLQSGLVACYSFTGNANDGSGHEHHGSVNGATLTADRNGVANSAYSFNGFSSYISIPPTPFINSNYSYSLWAKATSIPGDGDVGNIFSIGDETSRHQTVNFANSYSTAGFVGINCGGYNNGSPPTTSVQSGILPVVGRWYHIVSIRTNNDMKLYVDGVLIGTTSTNMNSPYYGSPVTANFGTRCNFVQYFHGAIDDVTIYNRAITADEVQELYENGLACTPGVQVDDIQSCGGGIFVVTASNGSTYRWYDANTGGNFLYEGNPFTTPNLLQTTSYYVSNFVNGQEGERTKMTIEIFPQPELTCDFPEILSLNESYMFGTQLASGTAPFTYTFDFGDGTIVSTTEDGVIHAYENSSTFIINVTVKDSNGCESSCSSDIQITEIVEVDDLQSCGGGVFVITASQGTTYRWYDAESGGNFLYEGNPFTTPDLQQTTSYYVSSFKDGAEGIRSGVTIQIYPQPELICNFPDTLFEDDSHTYKVEVLSGTAPFTYTFDFGDNTVISTPTDSTTYEYPNSGSFVINVSVTDFNGCQSSCTSDIRIIKEEIFIPNVITPDNGDELNQVFTVYLKKEDEYVIYNGDKEFSMRIFNRWGREIFSTGDIQSGWQGRGAADGVYFFTIDFGKDNFKGWVQVM